MSLAPDQVVAVIVAVETYEAAGNWSLYGPVRDGVRFADWLIQRRVPKENIHFFHSQSSEGSPGADSPMKIPSGIHDYDAKQATIRDFFTKLLPGLAPPFLCLFWGGHGMIKDDDRLLFCSDATEADMRAVNLQTLLTYLASEGIGGPNPEMVRTLALIDACAEYAELKNVGPKIAPVNLPGSKRVAERQQFVLLSTSKGQYAGDLAMLKTGLFSQKLLERLGQESNVECLLKIQTIAEELQRTFQELTDHGEASQVPDYFGVRSWGKEREWPPRETVPPTEEEDPKHVSASELADLCIITSGMKPAMPLAVLDAALHETAPFISLANYLEGMERFRDCLRQLAATPPKAIFLFLELCRPHLQGIPRLLTWETNVASRLKVSLAECRALAAERKLKPAPPVVADLLQVIVEPIEGQLGPHPLFQLRVRVSTLGAPEAEHFLKCAGESAPDGPKLAEQFTTLFREAFGRITTMNFRVELVLPIELLVAGIDGWQVRKGLKGLPVIEHYPIALRSYDRRYNLDFKEARLRQEEKWRTLERGLVAQHFLWVEAPPCVRDGAVPAWEDANALALFALNLQPPCGEGELVEVIEALIMAGIPLAVWLRGHQGEVQVSSAALRKLFAAEPPHRWSQQALAFLKTDKDQRVPACAGLSLLWEDPAQPLPDFAGRDVGGLKIP